MKRWRLVILAIAVIVLQVSQVSSATAAMADKTGLSQNPLWELSARPKPSLEEIKAMRWTDLFANETASYAFDAGSLQQDKQNKNLVRVKVKAVYLDLKLLDKLNLYYQDKLENGDCVAYSEMQMVFQIKERAYAVTEYKIYSKQGRLLIDKKRLTKFLLVPVQTFADTMYEIAQKFLQASRK